MMESETIRKARITTTKINAYATIPHFLFQPSHLASKQRAPLHSSHPHLRLLNISANHAGEPFQNLLREHTGGAETCSFLHQLQEYVFSVLGDGSQALQINHKLTAIQICCRLLPHAPQQGRPWSDELALDHQPAVTRGVENGDLRHCFCPHPR